MWSAALGAKSLSAQDTLRSEKSLSPAEAGSAFFAPGFNGAAGFALGGDGEKDSAAKAGIHFGWRWIPELKLGGTARHKDRASNRETAGTVGLCADLRC